MPDHLKVNIIDKFLDDFNMSTKIDNLANL